MKLVMFRHGHDLQMEPESENRLSSEGRAQVARTTESFISAHALKITHCFSSPALRAIETAEIIASENQLGAVHKSPALSPTASSEEFDDLVITLLRESAQVVVVVGHEPNLGNAILRWSGLPENDPDDRTRPPWGIARGSAVLVTPNLNDQLDLRISSLEIVGSGTRPLPKKKTAGSSSFT